MRPRCFYRSELRHGPIRHAKPNSNRRTSQISTNPTRPPIRCGSSHALCPCQDRNPRHGFRSQPAPPRHCAIQHHRRQLGVSQHPPLRLHHQHHRHFSRQRSPYHHPKRRNRLSIRLKEHPFCTRLGRPRLPNQSLDRPLFDHHPRLLPAVTSLLQPDTRAGYHPVAGVPPVNGIIPHAQRLPLLRIHTIQWRNPFGLRPFRPLSPDEEAIDQNTLLHYTNVFDAILDAAYFAMLYLNYTNIPIVVTESGWPSKGDSSEPDATINNADTYNSNLIKHVLNTTGTPKHPGVATSTYIYELYNEDLNPGPTSQRNWGLFNVDGRPVYVLQLTDSGSVLSNDTSGETYCVAKQDADVKMLQAALDWACGPGRVNCSMMLQGGPCYEPDTVVAHATYAFNAYYQRMARADGACDFNGVATVTTTDPSHDGCTFSLSGGSNNTFINGNGTSMVPSRNSTVSGGLTLYNSVSFSNLAQALFWCSVLL
ncbi:hypothetical protein SSX86_017543 [Deinandra increscens subsp. villosa]|uniref:X8 domain-containing protein n=1 Tax=Deinandra increscens subsp. villosa TaxID=3103831 RepID=A0AAP0GX51_9ASTR